MPKPKVFVVQRPSQYDNVKRGWVNKFDLTPAKAYGDLTYLLHPGNLFKDKIPDVVSHLQRELKFFRSCDYILPVGDPVAIAITVLVASRSAHLEDSITILKFDRATKQYSPYLIPRVNN